MRLASGSDSINLRVIRLQLMVGCAAAKATELPYNCMGIFAALSLIKTLSAPKYHHLATNRVDHHTSCSDARRMSGLMIRAEVNKRQRCRYPYVVP
jgi:hypothetical protein